MCYVLFVHMYLYNHTGVSVYASVSLHVFVQFITFFPSLQAKEWINHQ